MCETCQKKKRVRRGKAWFVNQFTTQKWTAAAR
jgi:hypothetical protein